MRFYVNTLNICLGLTLIYFTSILANPIQESHAEVPEWCEDEICEDIYDCPDGQGAVCIGVFCTDSDGGYGSWRWCKRDTGPYNM